MMGRFPLANAALSLALLAFNAPLVFSLDNSFVIQLHATRESFSLPEDGAKMRTQHMTTESGQQFECLLPSLASGGKNGDVAETTVSDSLIAKKKEEKEQIAAFMSFGRAAANKIKPKCVKYVDTQTYWVYEVCPGVLIRRVSHSKSTSLLDVYLPPVEVEVDAASDISFDEDKEEAIEVEAEELGEFVEDSSLVALSYDHFALPGMQERLLHLNKPLFTQTFGNNQQIQVQFICSALLLDDNISAVQWRKGTEEGRSREIAAFLIGSRMFCNPQHADVDENDVFTVRSLLQPLEEARTCVTRNEGWWTYEFCFGRSVKQYHRDGDGPITAEYSLGTFDHAGNQDLERLGSALVSEHIDATHDVSRPAYLELYDHGTFCKEGESRAPRKAKVFYYCSQGGASNHILAVKETQTCSYTVKVSSPVLCEHPHFFTDEQNNDEDIDILHCIPVAESTTTLTE